MASPEKKKKDDDDGWVEPPYWIDVQRVQQPIQEVTWDISNALLHDGQEPQPQDDPAPTPPAPVFIKPIPIPSADAVTAEFEIRDLTDYGTKHKFQAQLWKSLEKDDTPVFGSFGPPSGHKRWALLGRVEHIGNVQLPRGRVSLSYELLNETGGAWYEGARIAPVFASSETKRTPHLTFDLRFPAHFLSANLFDQDGRTRVRFLFTFHGKESQDLGQRSLHTLASDMMKLFQGGQNADYTIVCRDSKFPVHKLVLAARSTYFAKLFEDGSSEHTVEEESVSPTTMRLVLQYLYGSTAALYSLWAVTFDQLRELTAAADKFQLDELKQICFQQLLREIDLKHAGRVVTLAHLHPPKPELQHQIWKWCADNFEALQGSEEFKTEVQRVSPGWFQQLEFWVKYAAEKAKDSSPLMPFRDFATRQ